MQREKRTRLRWLDAARGLAMLLVMIGHTVPGNETVIGALYTFHLPLFFVISGYASRPVRDGRAFARRHVRSFFRLIVPCVVLQMGLMVYFCLLEGNLSAGRLIGLEKRAILQLFWASAQSVSGRPALGIPWFMFALFWGRMLFDLLRMVLERHAALACVLVSAAGLAIGTAAYLPQSLDLAMVSVLFLCAGAEPARAARRAARGGARVGVGPVAGGAHRYGGASVRAVRPGHPREPLRKRRRLRADAAVGRVRSALRAAGLRGPHQSDGVPRAPCGRLLHGLVVQGKLGTLLREPHRGRGGHCRARPCRGVGRPARNRRDAAQPGEQVIFFLDRSGRILYDNQLGNDARWMAKVNRQGGRGQDDVEDEFRKRMHADRMFPFLFRMTTAFLAVFFCPSRNRVS